MLDRDAVLTQDVLNTAEFKTAMAEKAKNSEELHFNEEKKYVWNGGWYGEEMLAFIPEHYEPLPPQLPATVGGMERCTVKGMLQWLGYCRIANLNGDEDFMSTHRNENGVFTEFGNFFSWVPLYFDDEEHGLFVCAVKGEPYFGKLALHVSDNHSRSGMYVVQESLEQMVAELDNFHRLREVAMQAQNMDSDWNDTDGEDENNDDDAEPEDDELDEDDEGTENDEDLEDDDGEEDGDVEDDGEEDSDMEDDDKGVEDGDDEDHEDEDDDVEEIEAEESEASMTESESASDSDSEIVDIDDSESDSSVLRAPAVIQAMVARGFPTYYG